MNDRNVLDIPAKAHPITYKHELQEFFQKFGVVATDSQIAFIIDGHPKKQANGTVFNPDVDYRNATARKALVLKYLVFMKRLEGETPQEPRIYKYQNGELKSIVVSFMGIQICGTSRKSFKQAYVHTLRGLRLVLNHGGFHMFSDNEVIGTGEDMAVKYVVLNTRQVDPSQMSLGIL